MPTVTAQVDGVSEVLGRLRAWETEKRAAVEAVVERFTVLIAREAQGLAAVDTGHLRDNIRPDLSQVASDLVGLVVSGASYSAFVEFGTSRMAAQPFLFKAFEMHARDFYDALRTALS